MSGGRGKRSRCNDDVDMKQGFIISQYTCAVLLIMSSIALVAYQVVAIDDVSNGLLVYVAQAFLLVGSIFGLDYYVKLITRRLSKGQNNVNREDH